MGKQDFLSNKGILLWCSLLYYAIPHVNDPGLQHGGRNTREQEYVKTRFPYSLVAVRWCHNVCSSLTSHWRNPRAAEIDRLFADNFKRSEWFNPSQARRQNLMCAAAWMLGLQPARFTPDGSTRWPEDASKKWLVHSDVLTYSLLLEHKTMHPFKGF